jgi:hypothetical protein
VFLQISVGTKIAIFLGCCDFFCHQLQHASLDLLPSWHLEKRWRLKIFGGSSWDNLGEIGVSTKSMKQMDGEYEKSPKPLGTF